MTNRTLIELNSQAFNHNAYSIKQIAPSKKVGAVIKGNGYGHGLIEIATLCQQSKHIDWLCVAYLSEALTLRAHNITKPILVLSYIDDELTKSAHQNISFMIDSIETANKLQSIGNKDNYVFNVHIKIDTGLCRHGVTPEAVIDFYTTLSNSKYTHIHIEGIYSHFVQSHLEDQTVTNQQKKLFKYTLNQLHNKSNNILIHMSNSASLFAGTIPDECNFVRVGLALYGLWPSEYIQNNTIKNTPLHPVLSWKVKIQEIKIVPINNSIGYNYTYTTKRNERIAILPVGYADGLPSSLSNNGYMIVENQRAPIVGKIAMNTCFIDVTDIPNAKKESVVTIIGKKLSAQECADYANIKNTRELFTQINSSITKIILPDSLDF